MSAGRYDFSYRILTGQVIGACYQVYTELGYGFLESVYEAAVALVLGSEGLMVERQAHLPVWFRGRKIGRFRADLIVNRKVIVELKAARVLEAAHEAQLLNALRSTCIEIGILFNFGPRPQFKRMAFSNQRKNVRVHLRSSAADSLAPIGDQNSALPAEPDMGET